MKKLYSTIIILCLFLEGVSNASSYKCEFEIATITIDVNERSNRVLKTGNRKNGKFENEDKIFAIEGFVSRMSYFSKSINNFKQSYDGYVYQNSKPGENNYFKGFFSEGHGYQDSITTIVIEVWEKNLPAYLYDPSKPNKVFSGNCK